jgi:hypothetical protein
LAEEIVHGPDVRLALSFEESGEAARDHVPEIHVVHWRFVLHAVHDRIPLPNLGNVRRDENLGGHVVVEQFAGSCYDSGGVNAAICLGGLLSVAGGDELRSSIWWLLLPMLLLVAVTSFIPQLVGCPSEEQAAPDRPKWLLPACCC